MSEHESVPDLEDRYTVRQNPNPDMDQMFEYEEVKDLPVNQVWTVVEGDDEKLYASAGFHIVNKLYYVVTEEPWTDEQEYYEW